MKIQQTVKAVLAALMISAGSHAMAAEITLNAAALPSYLNNSSYVGSFDGSALLPNRFAINSISFSFMFSDDASDPFGSTFGSVSTGSTTTTKEIPGTGGDKNRVVTTTNTTPVSRTGQQESVLLSFGDAIFGGATGSTTSSPVTNTTQGTEKFVRISYERGSGISCTAPSSACKTIYHYAKTNTATRTTTVNYAGDFGIAGSLLDYDSVLSSFIESKQLNFGLGVTGDLNLVNATLTLDYTKLAEVPEPAPLALFGIALAGLAGLRRARRA